MMVENGCGVREAMDLLRELFQVRRVFRSVCKMREVVPLRNVSRGVGEMREVPVRRMPRGVGEVRDVARVGRERADGSRTREQFTEVRRGSGLRWSYSGLPCTFVFDAIRANAGCG